MDMKEYLKSIIWECILVSLASAGLAMNIYNGFDMKDVLSFVFPAIFVFEFIIIFLIYFFAYNRKRAIIGTAIGVALVVACALIFNVTKPFNDEEMGETYAAFWAVLLFTAIVVYFITRPKMGCWILLVGGNIVCAGATFLEFGLNVEGYISFLIATAALIFIWVFKKSRGKKKDERKINARFALQSVLVGACAMVVAALIAVFVLIPLHLPTSELKLIEELRTMDVVHKVGVSIILPDLQDNESNDDEEQTKDSNDSANENDEENESETETENEPETEQEQNDNKNSNSENSEENGTIQSIEEEADAIRYDFSDYTGLIIACIVVILFVASIVYKKWSRKKWYENVCRMKKDEAVIQMYRFFVKRLELVKIKRKSNLTLEEYAKASKKFTEPFICDENNFQKLTKVYVKVYYGKAKVSDEEWQMFKDAYEDFYFNIKDEVGKWRYILLFYRI